MTLRLPHHIRKMEDAEVDHLNDDLLRAYSHKLESRLFNDAGTNISVLYQHMECGRFSVSANGSAIITRVISFAEPKEQIVYATAHAISDVCFAHVIDVTGTSVTIETRSISGTAVFSSVTTASITVYFQVIGGAT